MPSKKKFLCVVDASTYINLAKTETSLGNLLNLFIAEFHFNYSSEVNREISRNINNEKKEIDIAILPNAIERHSKIKSTTRQGELDYEHKLFDIINTTDKGEKHNLALSIDLFFDNNKHDLLFLCDDFKARNGILNDSLKAFPIFNVWSSLDIVLYFYLTKGNTSFPFDIADSVMWDLNKYITTIFPNTSHKKAEEKIKRYYNYRKYLEIIKKTLYN